MIDRRARQRGRAWWPLAVAAPLLAWLMWPERDPPPVAAPAAPVRAAPALSQAAMQTLEPPRAPFSAEGMAERQAQRALWQQRLERAQTTLDNYRRSTRYPHTSQPLGERTDQARPNEWISEDRPFADPGERGAAEASQARIRTTQERVFVQGNESVRFSVSLRDRDERVLPLRVLHAAAREITPPATASLVPELALQFNDDGSDGDAVAGDGIFGAQLHPAAQGFAGMAAQIRVEARLQYLDRQGSARFDVIYTGEAPAAWQGGVRETLQDGSLHFLLKADIHRPGRYVVSARVDDATGTPLALLGFNDELAQGTQEIRLTLFGKLVRDAKPAFPLSVRDVDAFLLHADTFPDRSLMPRLTGRVHVSGEYAPADFSDAEWMSEQRARHLNELGRDVAHARAQVERLER